VNFNQFLPAFIAADAISNQAAALHQLAVGMGWPARLYTTQPSTRTDVASQLHQTYAVQSGDVNLLHFGIGSVLDAFLCEQPAPLALYHHNITPPEYLAAYNPAFARQAQLGRDHLPMLLRKTRFALADSDFNAAELKAAGYDNDIAILPPVLGRDAISSHRLQNSLGVGDVEASDGNTRWLFVGRLTPNKNQDGLIRAFAHYHHRIEPNSTLTLAGANRTAPGYDNYLRALAQTLNVADALQMGPVSEAELAKHYATAHVFVCLSQHEGFCVPLIEALNAGLPIVALARTAVADTLGEAGVLLNTAHPALVAETVHALLTHRPLREQVLAAQHQRAQAFAQPVVEAQARAALQHLARLLANQR
jgi:glycosyltransferase involved in cell wall biosynthesis